MSTVDLQALLAEDRWLRGLLRGLLDEHDAGDAVQDTWVAALEHGESRRAWLAVVARRFGLRSLRAGSRRARREAAAARAEAVPSAASLVAELELRQRVGRAVLELAEPFRSTVLLRFYEGLRPAEIAARLQVPAATVRTRVARGLARIRERLEAEGQERDWRALGLGLLAHGTPRGLGPAVVLATGKLLSVGVAAGAALLALALWLLAQPPRGGAPAEVAATAGRVEQDRDVVPAAPGAEVPARREQLALDPPTADPVAAPVPPFRLAGRVADTSGRPLPGVLVGIQVTDGPYPGGGGEDGQAAGTEPRWIDVPLEGRVDVLGASGVDGSFAFTLPPAKGRLLALGAHATVRGWAVHDSTADVAGIVLVAARAVDLAGVAVDERGQPVAGVAVSVTEGPLSRFPHPLERTFAKKFDSVTTDAAGAFALAALPAAPELALLFECEGFAQERVPLPSDPDRALRIFLQSLASACLTLRGEVHDQGGRSVAEATVRFGSQQTRTGADGRFQILAQDVQPGTTLCAVKVGHQPAWLPRFGERVPDWRGKTHEVTLTLGPGSLEISGRVLGPDGEPRAGMAALVADPSWVGGWCFEPVAAGGGHVAAEGFQQPEVARTDAGGLFTVRGLAARDYRIRVYDQDSLLCLVSEPIAAGSAEVVLRFPADAVRKRLAGRVLRRGGEPAAGVSVGAVLFVIEGSARMALAPASHWARTDADGRFELRELPRHHVLLGVAGDDVVRLENAPPVRVPPGHPDDGFVISVASRCQFRIVPPVRGLAPETAQFFDAAGAVEDVTDIQEGMSSTTPAVLLQAGESPVLSVSDEAVTVVFSRAGKETGRQSVVLRLGVVNVIRP